jgi:hypothetical protein
VNMSIPLQLLHQVSNWIRSPLSGSWVVSCGQTDMRRLMVDFRKCGNALENK